MTESAQARAPWWYWVATALFAAFTLYGIVAIGLALTGNFPIPEPSWAWFLPAFWFTLVSAILCEAVGVAGLIMRRAWAVPAFLASIALTLLYTANNATSVGIVLGAAATGFLLLPRLLALWLAAFARRRAWLRRA